MKPSIFKNTSWVENEIKRLTGKVIVLQIICVFGFVILALLAFWPMK
jgi:hypothetical protein